MTKGKHMSVSLIKKTRGSDKRIEEIPIATNAVFEKYWLAAAQQLRRSPGPQNPPRGTVPTKSSVSQAFFENAE